MFWSDLTAIATEGEPSIGSAFQPPIARAAATARACVIRSLVDIGVHGTRLWSAQTKTGRHVNELDRLLFITDNSSATSWILANGTSVIDRRQRPLRMMRATLAAPSSTIRSSTARQKTTRPMIRNAAPTTYATHGDPWT